MINSAIEELRMHELDAYYNVGLINNLDSWKCYNMGYISLEDKQLSKPGGVIKYMSDHVIFHSKASKYNDMCRAFEEVRMHRLNIYHGLKLINVNYYNIDNLSLEDKELTQKEARTIVEEWVLLNM